LCAGDSKIRGKRVPQKEERHSKDPVISACLRIIYLLGDGIYDIKTNSCFCRRQWKRGVAGAAGGEVANHTLEVDKGPKENKNY
jgi:hypothetical protein